jgi:deoxyadenosine/deoxycytidine kinase
MASLIQTPFIVSVEGNIGSGKSTILKALREQYQDIQGIPIVYVDEPVSQWEQIKSKDGKNMIELFYANPSKYAFSFQMMAYISRFTMIKQAVQENPNSVILTERCLLTDCAVFASMLHDQGHLLDEEFTIYKTWFRTFQQEIPVTSIVYVRCDPTTAFTRCKKRGRSGEEIPLDYLIKCHEKHEKWIEPEQPTVLSKLVIENDEAQMKDVLSSMIQFISTECIQNKD